MNSEVSGLARDDDDDDDARLSPPHIRDHLGHGDDDAKEDKDLSTALRRTQALFGCPIIYTTTTLSSTSNTATTHTDTDTTNASIPLQNSLPAPLSPLPTSFPTLRLLCSSVHTKRFPSNMGMNALLADRGARQAVVDKSGFRVDVVPGGSVWGRKDGVGMEPGLKERLRGGGVKARGFDVFVGEEGVVVE